MHSKDRCHILRPLQESGALQFGDGGKIPIFDAARLKGPPLKIVGREIAKIVWNAFFFLDKKNRKFDVFLAVGSCGMLLAPAMSTALAERYRENIPILRSANSRALSKVAGKGVLIIGDRLQNETIGAVTKILQYEGRPAGIVLLFDAGSAEKSRIPFINGAKHGYEFLVQGVISPKDIRIYREIRRKIETRAARRRA